MIWATVSFWSCFCWLYRASPYLGAKNIINLILVLTIWWCPCVESSLVLLEEGVCYDQRVLLAKSNYGGGNEDNGNLFQKAPSMHCCTQCPQPAAGHPWPMPPPETHEHSWASLGQSLVGSLLLSPGSWWAQGFVCALLESVSSVLCKFWQLYGGVNGNLLQKGLCHTQVCCTQSPCPCGSPPLTHTSL